MLENLIQQWLKLRQATLTHYNELCTTKNTDAELLQKFCQDLMDYISMGHLKMFEKLAEHHEINQAYANGLDKTLLPSIQGTTNTMVDFNDKYTEPKNFNTLSHDLSQIGELLAHRMDWEDALIEAAMPYAKGN